MIVLMMVMNLIVLKNQSLHYIQQWNPIHKVYINNNNLYTNVDNK